MIRGVEVTRKPFLLVGAMLLGAARSISAQAPTDQVVRDLTPGAILGASDWWLMNHYRFDCMTLDKPTYAWTSVTIAQRGAYNAEGKYWPLRVKAIATEKCGNGIGIPTATASFQVVLRFSRDDFGAWKTWSDIERADRTEWVANVPPKPLLASLKIDLRWILTDEDEYFAKHGVYASDFHVLRAATPRSLDKGNTATIIGGSKGFTATVTNSSTTLGVHKCSVQYGTGPGIDPKAASIIQCE